MESKLRTFGALVLAFFLVASVAGGAAAAIAWDTETTSTSTTSDFDGTTTSLTVYHGDATNSTYFEVDGATTSNLTLQLTPAENGVDYVAYSNDTVDTENSSAGHYSWTVTHDELDDIPRDVEGGEYHVQVLNDTGSVLLNDTTTLTNGNATPKAVMVVTEQATNDGAAMTNLVADRLSVKDKDVGFFAGLSLPFSSSDENESTPKVTTWSGYTTVNGSETVVDVRMDNTSTADSYDEAAADVESGEWMTDSTIFVNGVPHKVYKGEAPSDLNGTSVVYTPSSNTLTIDTSGEDYQDVRTLQLRGAAGESYGFGEMWSNFGYMTALGQFWPF